MTSPTLLTAATSVPTSLDAADPLSLSAAERDCSVAKRNAAPLPPLSLGTVLLGAHYPPPTASPAATPTTTTSSVPSGCDAYGDPDASESAPAVRLHRSWTGAPIRAIVPLPRRAYKCSVVPPQFPQPLQPTGDADTGFGEIWWEDEEEEEEEKGYDDAPSGWSQYCSYQSITAAEGLDAWSFEELRVECYAQSLVARGTKPPPVIQLCLAIPPAFMPRIVPRS